MPNPPEIKTGHNFTLVETGPMNRWHEHSFMFGGIERRGKMFLKDPAALTGAQISINEMAPGGEVPFYHRHQTHEELYFFISGEGQMKLDGRIVPVQAGSAVRLAPSVSRTVRNNGHIPLHFIVIQTIADSYGDGKDGEILPDKVTW